MLHVDLGCQLTVMLVEIEKTNRTDLLNLITGTNDTLVNEEVFI